MAMFDRFKKKEEKPEEKTPEIPPLPELPPLPGREPFAPKPTGVPPLPGPPPSVKEELVPKIPEPKPKIPEPEPLQLPKPEPGRIEVTSASPGPPPVPKRKLPSIPKPAPKPRPFVPREKVEVPEITPPRRPPMSTIKPHIFMKIERYREVVETIQKLKDEISDIKRNVKDLEQVDLKGSEKIRTAETIVNKMSELVDFFEKSFSAPEE